MSEHRSDVYWVVKFFWCVFVMTGTAYLVGWRDWNPWWFALATLLCG